MYIERILNSKKENQVKNIMENNIITLRKEQKKEKSNIKLKDSNILSFKSQEKNYLISSSSLNNIPNHFKEYWNKEKNKEIILMKLLKEEEEIMAKYSIDKSNLTKFILFQLNQVIINGLNNYENVRFVKNIFDSNIINKLIILLYEFSNDKYYATEKIDYNNIVKYKDNEIIIYNICKILIRLTVISSDFSFLITQNDKNLQLIMFSLKYFQKKNQFICSNLLILIYNLT